MQFHFIMIICVWTTRSSFPPVRRYLAVTMQRTKFHTPPVSPLRRRCTKLEELVVTENFIHELPESIGNLRRVTHLNADRNRLETLPQQIGELADRPGDRPGRERDAESAGRPGDRDGRERDAESVAAGLEAREVSFWPKLWFVLMIVPESVSGMCPSRRWSPRSAP